MFLVGFINSLIKSNIYLCLRDALGTEVQCIYSVVLDMIYFEISFEYVQRI